VYHDGRRIVSILRLAPAIPAGLPLARDIPWSSRLSRPRRDLTRGPGAISLAGLAHEPLTPYTYVVRPVVGATWLETPDLSNACEFEIDADGDWIGNRPAGVDRITASVESGGRITVHWSYRTPPGMTAPQEYCVYRSTSADIDEGNPSAVVDFAGDGPVEHGFDLADGVSYWFAVTARADGVESRMPVPAGPFVADASVPGAPSVAVARTF